MEDAINQYLVALAFRFGPTEYTALILLLLALTVVLAPCSLRKALGVAVLGLLLGSIWDTDEAASTVRMSFDVAFDHSTPLITIIAVFGFLLPRLVAYARQIPNKNATPWWQLVYNSVYLPETLPATLLMRNPWLARRWVLLLVTVWSALLFVYFQLGLSEWMLSAAVFGVGMVFLHLDAPWPPLLIGLQFSYLLEENLRRSLLLSRGDWSTFVIRPISAGLLAVTCLLIIVSIAIRRQMRARPPQP